MDDVSILSALILLRFNSWTWFRETQTLILELAGTRFCERIGREHRSNNVYYCIDLLAGTFFQRCYDNECRKADFRGLGAYEVWRYAPLYWR